MYNLALITTVNEQETIAQIVAALLLQDLRVLVVDAGSTDGTVAMAESAGALVLRFPRVPIRHAMLAGWEMALEDDAIGNVVQLDAGASHDPSDATRLLMPIFANGYDVMVGSRFITGSMYLGRPVRREMSRLAALACRLKSGAHLTDWTSGYRAFSRDALEELVGQRYRASMHGWQIEVLHHALHLGLHIGETAITYRAGRSSMNGRIALEAINTWRLL